MLCTRCPKIGKQDGSPIGPAGAGWKTLFLPLQSLHTAEALFMGQVRFPLHGAGIVLYK